VAYTLRSKRACVRFSSPIPGLFTLSNTLQAAACALELGVPVRAIRESLNTLSGVEGRMERVKLGAVVDFSVFIDYAHTPDALENLLLTARGFRRGDQRIVLVFGCGGDRDKTKRPLMGQIASRLADMVYVTSDNSRSERPQDIITDILSGMDRGCDHRVILSRAAAIETAIREARAGDILLLAGKGHERYEIDATGKHPFDEKAIALAAAKAAYPHGWRRDKDNGKGNGDL
jgi:UDP-N-acetylmuramoyl-L-alanyl-D-glutamate--2,6-diaminopimelate ligase